MNLKAIYRELLRIPTNKSTTYETNKSMAFEIHDNKIYFTPDGCIAYIMETEKFLLDPQKVFARNTGDVLEKIAGATYFDAHKTIMTQSGKYLLQKVRNDNCHVWVDKEKLKNFDKNCTFGLQENGGLNPVAVYEHGGMVGFILPVRVAKEDEVDK